VTRLATHNRHHDGYVIPLNKAGAMNNLYTPFWQNCRFYPVNQG
jgi:hypothetical protein